MIKHFWSGKSLALGALVMASVMVPCSAQDRQGQVPPVGDAPATNGQPSDLTSTDSKAQKPPEQKRLGRQATSPAVREILRMLDAGVSKEVIKAYLEGAPVTSQPTPSDMIALKEHGVADEITVALLKRSAQLAPPAQPPPQTTAPPVAARRSENTSYRFYLDPESYEYFQYYYLYPRTLANAYDRLGYYSWPYYPGYYGGPGPFFHRGLHP